MERFQQMKPVLLGILIVVGLIAEMHWKDAALVHAQAPKCFMKVKAHAVPATMNEDVKYLVVKAFCA